MKQSTYKPPELPEATKLKSYSNDWRYISREDGRRSAKSNQSMARSTFREYTATRKLAAIKHETGFSWDTLEYIWLAYKHLLPEHAWPHYQEMYFYFVFRSVAICALSLMNVAVMHSWMHMYPTWEQAPVVLWTPELVASKGCGVSKSSLRVQVMSYLIALAVNIQEIHWDDRLDTYNHVPELQDRFTAMLDTAPLFICQPIGKDSKLTFQPKYKRNCFKMQVLYCPLCAVFECCTLADSDYDDMPDLPLHWAALGCEPRQLHLEVDRCPAPVGARRASTG